MSEHEDSGEYVYLLAGDPAKMLEALSDPDGSPLIPATNQRKPNCFFYMKNCQDQDSLIEYGYPEQRKLHEDLKKAFRALNILPEDITAQLYFLREDLTTSPAEWKTLEGLVGFFREQQVPFIMIDESNDIIVGGYQPEDEGVYKGTESNLRLHEMFQ
jgi:hypothetical protein